MSESEVESNANDRKPAKKVKFQLKKISEIKELHGEELWAYVEKLHELLNKSKKKIGKYKEQIKKLSKEAEQLKATNDTSVKVPASREELTEERTVEAEAQITRETNQSVEENHASTVCSFVDEIRQAAEQAQNLNGFVYEPTSGLYYDQKTGYYYNAEYGLYYDGNTGCYYNYNQEKHAFEFHSQAQLPSNAKSSENANDDDNMFANYADVGDDADDDEVEFDEWGVITDKEKLRRIKEEKQLKMLQKLKRSKRKKKEKRKTSKHKKHTHKAKKRKKSRRVSEAEDAEKTDSSDNECESKPKSKHAQDIEDGELSSSDNSNSSSSSNSDSETSASDSESEAKDSIFTSGSRFQDIAKKYPPSLRIIVQETNLDALKVGSLSLITYKGGSLGREGNHDVIIPDVNVSKTHLKFHYDTKKSVYKCIDLGSRNGTLLNGNRMSISKAESIEHDLVHGSILQIAQTKLLCHVHKGNSTCGLCEPGLLIEPARETAASNTTVILSHKEQLKKLQKKYGLENEKFLNGKQTGPNYNDRAATRRTQVGSTTDGEKTQTASVNTEISSENKGFRMLSKLGWSKGEALGKSTANAGLLEPINVTSNDGKKGLGCGEQGARGVSLTMAEKRRIDTWKKTQERYQKADIFADSDDDSA